MGKKADRRSVEAVLAENFRRLKDLKKPSKLGVAPKTANNVENARHDTKLSTIAALADNFNIEPYQMLLPIEDEKFIEIVLAWAQSDARGRTDLHAIAKQVLKRSDADEPQSSSTTVHRRRDGSS